jgi:glutaminyl-tRNA synthetase
MAVLDPLKLIIDNYQEGASEELEAENNPEDESAGSRSLRFSRELYIEREDFMIDPPKKFFRLAPDREVRLKHAYYVTCVGYDTDSATGEVTAVHCTYDPSTKGGWSEDGRKVRGTLHWVSAPDAVDLRVRLFDRLFTDPEVDETEDFISVFNPESLKIMDSGKGEPLLGDAEVGSRYQFLRQGYFARDPEDTEDGGPVFNRIVALRDSWAKISKKSG